MAYVGVDAMTSHLITDEPSRKRIADLIMRLPASDKWEIDVKPYKPNRTVLQNRLYFHWLGHLSNETGYTKDELHELCKQHVLGQEIKEVCGQMVHVIQSTTDLNTKEFIDYLEAVEQFFASKGFLLPAPSYYNDAMKRG